VHSVRHKDGTVIFSARTLQKKQEILVKIVTAVKAMFKYCGTAIVCDSNPHCHYISAHCYQYVR
jgi:hypothetical protein